MGGFRVRDDELFVERRGKRHRAIERQCETCGCAFLAMCTVVANGGGRFCSQRCVLRPGRPTDRRPIDQRFWELVDKGGEADCWEWQGVCERFGYGVLSHRSKTYKAHRLSWQYANGPIPNGLWVLHHCDNPPCVNPAHLYVGTAGDNARDRARRGRGWETRQNGEASPAAKLTEADVRAIMVELERVPRRSQAAIAADFGIKQPQVSRIMLRQTWKHLWEDE